jgi:hypothetical protein
MSRVVGARLAWRAACAVGTAGFVLVAACNRNINTAAEPVAQPAAPSITVTNGLDKPVSVSLSTAGKKDLFLGQVAPQSSATLTARGVSSGATVTLTATTADGANTYTRPNVALTGTYAWQLP